MEIAPVTAAAAQIGGAQPPEGIDPSKIKQPTSPEKTAQVSQQFEAILMRQILSESMKPLLEGGTAGQVYGYLVTDSLADAMSKGGGLGLSHILQAQLTQ